MEKIDTAAAIFVSLASGALWIKSASISVRDNIDEFIKDLQRQGRWNACAAGASALAALLQASTYLLK